MEHRHSSHPVDGQQLNHPQSRTRAGTSPTAGPTPARARQQDDEHLVHSHGQHAGHSVAMFKNRFWLTLALAVPVVFFSPMFGHLLGYEPPVFPGSAWIPPVLGTVIFFYGGQPFLKGGLNELKTRKPGMMLLIAMAITVAFIASWATTLGIGGFDLDFWWELALLVDIMLLGHWLEMRALGSAQGALDALAALLPDEAERITGSGTETVGVSELRSGDTILVRSGGRMPADGTVIEGQAEFDESMITGESKTVLRSPGDPVVAGTIATDNSLRVQVTAIGEDTALAGIQRLVAEAQASSSRAQALADRAAAFLFYFAAGRGRPHLHRLDAAGQCARRRGAHRDGAGDRLPARPRPGHPAGHRDLDGAGGPGRRADQGPDGARADADGRRRAVRQDGDPDQGRAGTQRHCRRRRDRPGRAACAGRCGGVGQRAPRGARHRGRRPRSADCRSRRRAISPP